MSGHCSVHNCTVSRNKAGATNVISFHAIMTKKPTEWRDKLIHSLGRDFHKEGARPKYLTICSRHFEESCFRRVGNKTMLIEWSLPTKFLPSCVTPKQDRRPPPVERAPPPEMERVVYYDFADMKNCITKSPLSQWAVLLEQNHVFLINNDMKIQVNSDFQILLTVDVRSVAVEFDLAHNGLKGQRGMLAFVTGQRKCEGLDKLSLKSLDSAQELLERAVVTSTKAFASDCKIFKAENHEFCSSCTSLLETCRKKKMAEDQPLHKNTPLSLAARSRLAKALKDKRKEAKSMKKRLDRMKKRLEDVEVSDPAHADLMQIMEGKENHSEFVQLFWNQQKTMFQKQKNGHRWHPMLIRYALLIHSQSPLVYRTLKDTGVLRLPSESTLRAFTNAIHPTRGFNPEVIEHVKNEVSKLPPEKRFVTLLHDEMHIKADLVYDSHSGEMIGFVNSNTNPFREDIDDIATQVLVFYIVGINSGLSLSLGFFPTKSATSSLIYSKFWQAVAILETQCGLKVIVSTSDKAKPNMTFIGFHKEGSRLHCTKNLFANEERNLYFMSDVPHLIKTIRNNIADSSLRSKAPRRLWNGSFILWQHFFKLYADDMDNGLRRTKLTYDHLHLTPQSKMRVYLAAQVLSATNSVVMKKYGGPDAQETAKFAGLTDRFFDCTNGITLNDIKPDRRGYTSPTDERFNFLKNVYLNYLETWKNHVQEEKKAKKLSAKEANRMFLTDMTYNGIRITVNSFIEATVYLLNSGCQFVLPRRFCQDPLEEHFGRHRMLGCRSDNPTIRQFMYQENQLRQQRSLALQFRPKGNTRGAKRTQPEVKISSSPLKRRKKQHKSQI